MDHQIDARALRSRAMKKVGRWAIIALLIVSAFAWLRHAITPGIALSNLRTGVVEPGEVSSTVVASGVVSPKFEEVIASPIVSRVQTVFATLGAEVGKGDPLLKLDSTQIELEITRINDQLELKAVEERALRQQNTADISDLQSRRELLGIDEKSQRLRLERYRELYENNAVSKFELDDRAIQLEKTRIEQRQLDRRVADLRATAANHLDRLALEKKLLEQQLAEQQRLLEESTVKAVSAGVITSLLSQPGQSVGLGTELARIADLSRYHVEANLSDFYRSQLREGMPANILINDLVVAGKVSKILPTVAAEGVLLINVDFAAPESVRLQPNMRVELEVITRQEANGLRMRNGPALNGSGVQEVFVVRGNTLEKRQIQTGLTNTQFVQVVSGLTEGETIVLSNMDSYLHLDEVALR